METSMSCWASNVSTSSSQITTSAEQIRFSSAAFATACDARAEPAASAAVGADPLANTQRQRAAASERSSRRAAATQRAQAYRQGQELTPVRGGPAGRRGGGGAGSGHLCLLVLVTQSVDVEAHLARTEARPSVTAPRRAGASQLLHWQRLLMLLLQRSPHLLLWMLQHWHTALSPSRDHPHGRSRPSHLHLR